MYSQIQLDITLVESDLLQQVMPYHPYESRTSDLTQTDESALVVATVPNHIHDYSPTEIHEVLEWRGLSYFHPPYDGPVSTLVIGDPTRLFWRLHDLDNPERVIWAFARWLAVVPAGQEFEAAYDPEAWLKRQNLVEQCEQGPLVVA